MLVIGERINGNLQKVATTIRQRDAEYIAWLAKEQTLAGADYLYLNAATPPEEETGVLKWLVEVVQNTVDTPICLDSANPQTIEAVLPLLHRPGILNSLRYDGEYLRAVLPVVRDCGCTAIALLMEKKEVPRTVEGRMNVAEQLIETAGHMGLKHEQLYLDPTVMAIATQPEAGKIFLDTLYNLQRKYSSIRTVTGLRTIAFGLPDEKAVTRAFLVLAAGAGLDAIIMNPLDADLRALLRGARVVTGREQIR